MSDILTFGVEASAGNVRVRRTFFPRGAAKRIRCQSCGWSKRVDPLQVGIEILYHRDIECPNRIAPSERPRRTRSIGSAKGQRVRRPERPRCPTCRESLALVNGAYGCVTGCTNEPTVR